MIDIFLGMIILWPGQRIPDGYLACQGQLLQIQQYEALYSLIGITYGGDGKTTFALPDLRSRIAIGQGQGTSLTNRPLGSTGGAESVILTTANMAAHTHAASLTITPGSITGKLPSPLAVTASVPVSQDPGTTDTPGGGVSFAQAPDFSGSTGDYDYIYGPVDKSMGALEMSVAIPGGETGDIDWYNGNIAREYR